VTGGAGYALSNMSVALDKLGDRTQAVTHAEAALKIHGQIEDPNVTRIRKQLADWRRADEARKQIIPGDSPPAPDPAADSNRAARRNIQYQKDLAAWEALPWLKRHRTPKPQRPMGI
jgi:hypothetical protein